MSPDSPRPLIQSSMTLRIKLYPILSTEGQAERVLTCVQLPCTAFFKTHVFYLAKRRRRPRLEVRVGLRYIPGMHLHSQPLATFAASSVLRSLRIAALSLLLRPQRT